MFYLGKNGIGYKNIVPKRSSEYIVDETLIKVGSTGYIGL
jgi:hypothetical protein